jgi:hypothetical protein
VADHSFDDAPVPVSSAPAGSLPELVFGVYRELDRARRQLDQQSSASRAEAADLVNGIKRRLAHVAAEALHLRRTAASVREPLRAAGLDRELNRFELMVKRFDTVLERYGVRVETLDGREVDDQLADLIDVESYVYGPVATPRVRETLEPLVLVDDQVVLRPKVVTEVPRREE